MEMWHIATALMGIALIIACGCIGQATSPQATHVPTESPTLATPSPTASIAPVTRAQTPAPTTVATTAQPTAEPTPANPLPGPVTLKGVGSQIVWFETVAPGEVKITFRYNGDLGYTPKCTEKETTITLAGKSIDATIFTGMTGARYNKDMTYNLLFPGRYSLSVKGCYGWEISVDNA